MDGLSIANTGALKESTSADFASRAEQIVQADPTNDTRQVQTTATNRAVRQRSDDERSGGRNQALPDSNKEETFEDGLAEETPDNTEDFEEEHAFEEMNNPNREFYVKLNTKDDIIELYDSATERLIETISGSELRQLVCKLNMASGIFINKKV